MGETGGSLGASVELVTNYLTDYRALPEFPYLNC